MTGLDDSIIYSMTYDIINLVHITYYANDLPNLNYALII